MKLTKEEIQQMREAALTYPYDYAIGDMFPSRVIGLCDLALSALDRKWRPCIHNLAVEMEGQLKRNEYRGGWCAMNVRELKNRIEQNLNDLSNLQPGTVGFTRTCADIANYTAMLLENNPQEYVFEPPKVKP